MRIHGDVRIQRSTDISNESDYKNYRTPLSVDFHEICGYCGKSMIITRKGFEIDHFVPISMDETRTTDYHNLVLSCFTCNRKKGKKWPTRDKNICHDGQQGFVDPCADEYDTHLERELNGSIIHKTPVGQYMHGAFKFGIRPTDTVWRCMQLVKKKQQVYQIQTTKELSNEKLHFFFEIQKELDGLLVYLLGEGE